MSSKRNAVEFLYWARCSREEIFRLLKNQYDVTEDYIDEVCTMMENDDYLLEE